MKVYEKDGKMLVLKLSHSRHDNQNGFFKEISPNDIPKSILEDRLSIVGGAGTVWENYWRSNTAGETLGKYFIHVADRIKFVPKNIHRLELVNDANDFITGINIITDALEKNKDDLRFQFDYWDYSCYEDDDKNYIECELRLIFDKDDYIHLNHPFEEDEKFPEYKEFFFGRDKAILNFYFQFPCKLDGYKKLDNFIKLMGSNYSIEDIQNFLNPLTDKQRWYFSMDENLTFYGNS